MKIINSFVLLIILVCGSQLSHGEKLNCKFEYWQYSIVGELYSCVVTSLDNPNNNLKIDGYSGEHLANKNDADVKGIYIHDTNTKYIPTNLGSLFNLIVLNMWNTQLVEIKANDFHGMENLESISFWDNKLSSVPLDAFATLTKLIFINLSSNQIEELPNGIFKNCLELEEIYLNDNRIKYLGTKMFNGLKKLNYVGLRNNICDDENYDGATEINQLKEDIKMKCKNPNEVPATTTTTTRRRTTTSTTQTPTSTTTTQNPMEEKLIEMQEQITKLENELRESKELKKKSEDLLNNQLREANELHKKNEDLLNNQLRETMELQKKNEAELTNEKETLIKQLRESKEQQQTNEDALKKNIYGLNQSLFDKKREFHLFKTTCVQIRNKLKKAKENLAKCPNVNPRDLM